MFTPVSSFLNDLAVHCGFIRAALNTTIDSGERQMNTPRSYGRQLEIGRGGTMGLQSLRRLATVAIGE